MVSKSRFFAQSQTTNKLVNEAGKIEKKTALGTNQIAGFGGFHPLASLEENKYFS